VRESVIFVGHHADLDTKLTNFITKLQHREMMYISSISEMGQENESMPPARM
jgi:hypothetical protein